MDPCMFCGLPYEKEVKEGTTHHFAVCQSDCMVLLHQLRKVIKLTSHYNICCNACHQEMSTSVFTKHLEESHSEVLYFIQKLVENQKKDEDNKIVTCVICKARFPAWSRYDHMSLFHSDSLDIVKQVTKTLDSTFKPNSPAMKCCTFCGEEYIIEEAVHHISKCKGESVLAVKQLSDRLKAVSHSQFKPFLVERCKVCGVRVPVARLVDHIAEVHPSGMQLVQKLAEQASNAPGEGFTSCGLCHRLFPNKKLLDHYNKCHPESKSVAKEITKTLNTFNLKRNSNCTTQDRRSCRTNFLSNEDVATVKKISKVIRMVAKKKKLLNKPKNNFKKPGRVGIIKANVGKTQRRKESKVNVAESDEITFDKNEDLQLSKKPKRYSGSNFKANVKKEVVGTSLCENQKQQESNKILCVRLERLSSRMYEECLTNGYVVLKENNSNQSMANLEENTDSCLSKEVMENPLETNSENLEAPSERHHLEANLQANTHSCFSKEVIENTLENVNLEAPSLRIFLVVDKIPIEITSPAKKPVGSKIVPAPYVTTKTLNPYVKLERLSSRFIQEHVNPECLVAQKEDDDFIESLFKDICETVAISQEFVKNLKDLTNPIKSTNVLGIAELKKYKKEAITSNNIPFNPEYVSPECLVEQKEDNDFIPSLVNDASETVAISQEFVKNMNDLTKNPVKHTTLLGIAELKKYKKKALTSNNIPLANFMEKMIKKTRGKEMKKQILYCQKQLQRYVLKHKEIPPDLKDKLIDACKYLRDPQSAKEIVHELLSIKNQKIRFIVRYLLNKLLRAVKKVPV